MAKKSDPLMDAINDDEPGMVPGAEPKAPLAGPQPMETPSGDGAHRHPELELRIEALEQYVESMSAKRGKKAAPKTEESLMAPSPAVA